LRQNAGAIDEYLALAVEARRIADRSGDRGARAAAGSDHIYALYCKGRLAECVAVAEAIRELTGGDVQLGVPLVGYSVYLVTYVFSGWALIEMARLREAEASAVRALEMAQQYGLEETRCWTHIVWVNLGVAKGDPGPKVLARARLAAEAAERAGSDQARAMAHLALSVAGAQVGEWEMAIAAAEEGLSVWRTKRVCGDFAAQMLAAHARALLGAGARERACEASAEAIAVAQLHGQPVHELEATLADVRCLREFRGGEARAIIEARLLEASRLIDQTRAERWRPHVHVERGELQSLFGESDAATREFAEAHRLFAAMGATGFLPVGDLRSG
jgi:tetratricopeptide (TPR) repeat protein